MGGSGCGDKHKRSALAGAQESMLGARLTSTGPVKSRSGVSSERA